MTGIWENSSYLETGLWQRLRYLSYLYICKFYILKSSILNAIAISLAMGFLKDNAYVCTCTNEHIHIYTHIYTYICTHTQEIFKKLVEYMHDF